MAITRVQTQLGEQNLVYCDYGASGRADPMIEDYISSEVLPFMPTPTVSPRSADSGLVNSENNRVSSYAPR
jgi:hypothetical protein